MKGVGIKDKDNNKEALKFFKAAYGLGNKKAKEELKNFYNKKQKNFNKAENITFGTSNLLAAVGCVAAVVTYTTTFVLVEKTNKYKNKIKKLNRNSTQLLKSKYSFMYDKQGNFRNKDNLKGYNLKKARRKSAKFIFNALKSGELTNEEKAFYCYEFSKMILNEVKDYTKGFTKEEGLEFLRLSAERGYEKARRKYSKYLSDLNNNSELYSSLTITTEEIRENFERNFSFLLEE